MTTYTDNLKLRKPDIGQTSWGDEIQENIDITDFALGGLLAGNVVLSGCAPSIGTGLAVDYAGGEVSVNGTRHTITGGSKTCTASVMNWLCVDASGVVQIYTSPPTAAYAALAMVDAGATTLDRIGDARKLAEGAAAFDLTYTPDNYSPDTGESKEIEQHLAGIDTQLGFMGAFKNKLINGGFTIWNRGISQTTNSIGSDDRWFNWHWGITKTHFQVAFLPGQTDVPGNPLFYSRTVPALGTLDSDNCIKRQRIEGVRTLSGQKATLSFYAKADAAKDIATEFTQNFGTGGTPSAEIDEIEVTTFSLTTSWAKYSVTVDIPSISGKTIGTAGNDYLELRFWFSGGSYSADNNNSLGNQAGTFDLAQVQLEAGEVATPFEQRDIGGVELALCQRYYETNYGSGVYPGAAQMNHGVNTGTATNNYIMLSTDFKVTKRDIPSITVYDAVGNSGKVTLESPAGTKTDNHTPSITAADRTTQGFRNWIHNTGNSGYYYNWVAIAEL